MQKKTATKFYRALPLGLLFCLLAGGTPIWGQEPTQQPDRREASLRPYPVEDVGVSLSSGFCFDTENPHRVCYVLLLDVQFYGFPLYPRSLGQNSLFYRPFSGSQAFYERAPLRKRRRRADEPGLIPGFSVMATTADMWPPPGCSGSGCGGPQAIAKTGEAADIPDRLPRVDYDFALSFLGNISLPIPVEPAFLVEAQIGMGFTVISGGEQKGNDFALHNQTVFPVFSYGLGVVTHLKNQFDLVVKVRTLVFFTNKLNYVGPEGNITRDDFDKIDATILVIGLGKRF